jgi:hypothetical protein
LDRSEISSIERNFQADPVKKEDTNQSSFLNQTGNSGTARNKTQILGEEHKMNVRSRPMSQSKFLCLNWITESNGSSRHTAVPNDLGHKARLQKGHSMNPDESKNSQKQLEEGIVDFERPPQGISQSAKKCLVFRPYIDPMSIRPYKPADRGYYFKNYNGVDVKLIRYTFEDNGFREVANRQQ